MWIEFILKQSEANGTCLKIIVEVPSLADVDISVYKTFFRLKIYYFDVC